MRVELNTKNQLKKNSNNENVVITAKASTPTSRNNKSVEIAVILDRAKSTNNMINYDHGY